MPTQTVMLPIAATVSGAASVVVITPGPPVRRV